MYNVIKSNVELTMPICVTVETVKLVFSSLISNQLIVLAD